VCIEQLKRFTDALIKRKTIGRLTVEALALAPFERDTYPRLTDVTMVTSAGLLLYRRRGLSAEVFLVHPGGPFWAKKDDGAWSVPKGVVNPHEDELACARREFQEETGFDARGSGYAHDLGIFMQPSGKRLHIWALEGDCNPADLNSNLFELEWPPKSGRHARFPEVDRGSWFDREQALLKISKGQRPVVENFYIYFKTVAQ